MKELGSWQWHEPPSGEARPAEGRPDCLRLPHRRVAGVCGDPVHAPIRPRNFGLQLPRSGAEGERGSGENDPGRGRDRGRLATGKTPSSETDIEGLKKHLDETVRQVSTEEQAKADQVNKQLAEQMAASTNPADAPQLKTAGVNPAAAVLTAQVDPGGLSQQPRPARVTHQGAQRPAQAAR